MKHFYTYDYVVNLEDGYGNKLQSYSDSKSIGIWENLQDIFEYLFEKEYNVKYNDLNWFLEPNARLFYKDLEDMWIHNTLDTSSLYTPYSDFKEYMMRKYSKDVKGSIEGSVINNIRETYSSEEIVLYNISSDYFEIEGEIQA